MQIVRQGTYDAPPSLEELPHHSRDVLGFPVLTLASVWALERICRRGNCGRHAHRNAPESHPCKRFACDFRYEAAIFPDDRAATTTSGSGRVSTWVPG